MAEQFSGQVEVLDSASTNVKITLDGDNADISIGDNGQNGDVILKDSAGNERIRINGQTGNVIVKNAAGNEIIRLNGSTGDIILGGNGSDGDVVLKDGADQNRIRLDAGGGNAWLGGNGADGDIVLFPTGGDNSTLDQATIHLDGQGANIWAGGNGADGDLVLFPSGANDINDLSQATIHLNGDSGDIILKNADAAEHFDVADGVTVEPGMIMALNGDGKLKPSSASYDKKVVGVIAGAGDHRPGIIMDNRGDNGKRIPVSVLGKVSCKADATHAPIEVGDLLTTSQTIGYAMKATDPKKSFGSIIGKALSPLSEGVGFVDMLVTLQ